MGRPPKHDWRGTVLPAAADFVASFTTGVTLRQCFYYLASHGYIDNTSQDYDNLSGWTTRARDGAPGLMEFPDLIDYGRSIRRPVSFTGPADARQWLRSIYRRDRTEFADTLIYLGVEKVGLAAQLEAAFDVQGLPILALAGWSSQTFREQVRREILADGRPAVLIYAGDFDPAGVAIDESFADKVGAFRDVIRVGLNVDQLAGLTVSPFPMSKLGHSLIPRFRATYGDALEAIGLPRLVQFELDALDPGTLLELYQSAIDRFFDLSAYQRSRDLEATDLVALAPPDPEAVDEAEPVPPDR